MASGEGVSGSALDPYGFERPEDFDHKTYNDFISNYLKVLAHRKMQWEKLHPTKKLKHSAKVKRYIRKGVPDENRKVVWLAVSGAQKLWDQHPNLYRKLLGSKFDEQAIEIIKIDIPRTFPNNIYFQQPSEGFLEPLFNVLLAFVNYHPEIGYCQGLNYIAGLLLLMVKDEEAAFWLLTTLVEKILPDYYSRGMKGLLVDTDVLGELIQTRQPFLSQHLTNLGMTWPMLCTKWFICLFIDTLPVEALMACTDLREAVNCISDFTRSEVATQCHDFMKIIFKVPGKLTSKKVQGLRDKYSAVHQAAR